MNITRTISFILVAGCAAIAMPAQAQSTAGVVSTEETVGFFSGAAIGAAAGGPAGAIVGAGAGALIGAGWNLRDLIAQLESTLGQTRSQLAAAQAEAQAMEERLRIAQQEIETLQSGPGACCEDVIVSINFRTNSSAIESHYEEQLESVARLANVMGATVEIIGHADRRGSDADNMALSTRRSETVRDFLSARGVDSSSINASGAGESSPLQSTQSTEGDFFDRRVIVRLNGDG